MESVAAAMNSVPQHLAARLEAACRPADDSPVATEPSAVPEARQSAQVPKAAVAQLELSLEMLA
jgi:hypothetical protein